VALVVKMAAALATLVIACVVQANVRPFR